MEDTEEQSPNFWEDLTNYKDIHKWIMMKFLQYLKPLSKRSSYLRTSMRRYKIHVQRMMYNFYSSSNTSSGYHKLPKLSLSSFDGDIFEWPCFENSFGTVIHTNTTLRMYRSSTIWSLFYRMKHHKPLQGSHWQIPVTTKLWPYCRTKSSNHSNLYASFAWYSCSCQHVS